MSKTTAPIKTASAASKVEFIRCPAPKQRDPIFGLTRAWFYRHAALGDIKMVSLRKRGEVRGVALVDADSVRKFIKQCIAAGQSTAA